MKKAKELELLVIPTSAIALSLDLLTEWVHKFMEGTNAKRKVEVRLTIDGQTKEFTFAEFKKLLGFENPVERG